MFEIGTKLYCHTNLPDSKRFLTKGKNYTIIGEDPDNYYDPAFVIKDNTNKNHSFSYSQYEKWFLSFKTYRKEKLEKLNKC